MVDKIRQLFLTILGIAAFGFVFYLVFKDDKGFMLAVLAVVVGLIILVLLLSLIGRFRDHLREKRRKRPFKHYKN